MKNISRGLVKVIIKGVLISAILSIFVVAIIDNNTDKEGKALFISAQKVNETSVVDKEKSNVLERTIKPIEEVEVVVNYESSNEEDITSEDMKVNSEIVSEEELPVVINVNNLLEPSNISAEDLANVFRALPYAGNLVDIAPLFVEAENTYGINAIILASIASWESDYARSKRSVEDYNLFGWGVYTAESEGVNSCSYKEGVMKTTEGLKNDYLSENGKYFNGYSLADVNIRYCLDTEGNPDLLWHEGISSIAKTFYRTYNNNKQ